MLHKLEWKLGRNEKPLAWRDPLILEKDAEGILWAWWDTGTPPTDDERLPICYELEPGIYEGYNIEHWIIDDHCDVQIKERKEPSLREFAQHPERYRSEYGTADNLDQIKEYFASHIADPDRRYILEVNEMHRDTHSGFRQHKNGPYIGAKRMVAEHFGDEPEIDTLFLFHIWEIE